GQARDHSARTRRPAARTAATGSCESRAGTASSGAGFLGPGARAGDCRQDARTDPEDRSGDGGNGGRDSWYRSEGPSDDDRERQYAGRPPHGSAARRRVRDSARGAIADACLTGTVHRRLSAIRAMTAPFTSPSQQSKNHGQRNKRGSHPGSATRAEINGHELEREGNDRRLDSQET